MLVKCDVVEICSYNVTDCISCTAFGAWTVSGSMIISARLGFSVAIPCTPPAANPPPVVVWQADGVDIAAGDPLNGGAAQRVQVLPTGHLVIHDLGAGDLAVAQYRCSVRNVRTHSTSDSPQSFTLMNGMYVLLSTMCTHRSPVLILLSATWPHCTSASTYIRMSATSDTCGFNRNTSLILV